MENQKNVNFLGASLPDGEAGPRSINKNIFSYFDISVRVLNPQCGNKYGNSEHHSLFHDSHFSGISTF